MPMDRMVVVDSPTRLANPRQARQAPTALFVSFLLAIFMAACGPVRLVSAYDEGIDRGASEIHTATVAFVHNMTILAGQPAGAYEGNRSFYANTAARISTLKLRAQVQGVDDTTTKLLDELSGNLDLLRELHEMRGDAGLPKQLADPALSAIEINCLAIIKFEVAKRRGDKD